MKRPEDRKTPGRKRLGENKKIGVSLYLNPELIEKLKKRGSKISRVIEEILEGNL